MREFTEIKYPETVDILKQPKSTRTDIKCPDCEGVMVVRDGGYGKFLGCSMFPKCRTKVGFQQPLIIPSATSMLASEAFGSKNYETDQDFEDTMRGFYPGGVHCKGDM
ncbi:MAG TPA: hypothetical protein GX707_16635 [Epulopiscium sp.]|nr:hypothetical protein [Candidatus Epulonipiscium sp.]